MKVKVEKGGGGKLLLNVIKGKRHSFVFAVTVGLSLLYCRYFIDWTHYLDIPARPGVVINSEPAKEKKKRRDKSK